MAPEGNKITARYPNSGLVALPTYNIYAAVKGETAPRASNVTDPGVLDRVVRGPLAPSVDVMEVELGGAPAGRMVANPPITCCLPFVSNVPGQLGFESVPRVQAPVVGSCFIRKHTGLFRRTASNRVNFSMSDKRAAASFSWYVRNDRMSDGIAMAVRMRSTVMETANSTVLKPPMRLRRVREMGALLYKVISSFKAGTRVQPERTAKRLI